MTVLENSMDQWYISFHKQTLVLMGNPKKVPAYVDFKF